MINRTSIKTSEKTSLFLFNLLLLTPLVFGGGTKWTFEFPKVTLLYSIVGLMMIVALTSLTNKKAEIILPNKFVSIFVVISLLSTILSSHKYTSIWSYYSRFNGGLLSTITLFSLYIIILNNNDRYKKCAEDIPLLTIIPISLYAIGQHYAGLDRAYSTFGQPNWLAAYMVMLIPLILKRYFMGEKKIFFLYVLSYCSLWFSYSLSGMLGFIVASGYTIMKTKPSTKKALGIIAITFFISLTNLGIFTQRISDLWIDVKDQFTYIKKAYAQQEHSISDPGFIRFGAWKGTVKLILSSPKVFLIGTGPETFPYEFQKFRPSELNYSSEWDYIINKPHNYYLELFSEIGVFGFLVYIAILWQNRKNPYFPNIVGFAITNIFGWPVVSTAILFWAWMGFNSEEYKTAEVKMSSIYKYMGIVLALILMLNAWKHYNADIYFIKSMDAFKNQKMDLALGYIDKAINKNPNEPNYPKQKARVLIAANGGKAQAMDSLMHSYELNPSNLATKRDIIPLYFYLSVKDIRLPESETNLDPDYLPLANDYYNKLKNEYPTDAGTLADIAEYEKRFNTTGYEETKSMVEKLRPDLLTWYKSFR